MPVEPMPGAASKTRTAIALGLVMLLGSLLQLPHQHAMAETLGRSAPAQDELRRPQPAAADEADCPVCVLQRLLSQAQAIGSNALESPGATGMIAGPPVPPVFESVPRPGSPRGPPPSA